MMYQYIQVCRYKSFDLLEYVRIFSRIRPLILFFRNCIIKFIDRYIPFSNLALTAYSSCLIQHYPLAFLSCLFGSRVTGSSNAVTEICAGAYIHIRTRMQKGGLTSGRFYPEYPPRCLAQWGLSSFILSTGEPREEEIVRRTDVIFSLGRR